MSVCPLKKNLYVTYKYQNLYTLTQICNLWHNFEHVRFEEKQVHHYPSGQLCFLALKALTFDYFSTTFLH